MMSPKFKVHSFTVTYFGETFCTDEFLHNVYTHLPK